MALSQPTTHQRDSMRCIVNLPTLSLGAENGPYPEMSSTQKIQPYTTNRKPHDRIANGTYLSTCHSFVFIRLAYAATKATCSVPEGLQLCNHHTMLHEQISNIATHKYTQQ